jgi:hypothetical protein
MSLISQYGRALAGIGRKTAAFRAATVSERAQFLGKRGARLLARAALNIR